MGKRKDKIVRLTKRLRQKQKRIKSLAIAVDPNQVIKTRSVKSTLKNEPEPENQIKQLASDHRRTNLEKLAARPPAKRYRYGTEISKFCAHMIAKHGDDYQSMQCDPMNHFQESAGSIKRMILKFKGFKVNQNAYLLAEQMVEQELNK